jgi:TonB family protein
MKRALVLTAMIWLAAGCADRDSTQRMAQAIQGRPAQPDEFPKVLNTELPFRYPAALYARRVQGNVTLRLYIDQNGRVSADSTRIEESSGQLALDSSALKGSQELRFVPAKLRGEPQSATVLFPVYFRHPEARALPGDTILNRPAQAP